MLSLGILNICPMHRRTILIVVVLIYQKGKAYIFQSPQTPPTYHINLEAHS